MLSFHWRAGGLVLSPKEGPVLGGTPIIISGANFTGGSDRRCRLTPLIYGVRTKAAQRAARERTVEVAATLQLPNGGAPSLRCVTPALPLRVATLTLEVSLNGQQFSSEGVQFGAVHHDGWPARLPERGAWGLSADKLVDLSFTPDLGQVGRERGAGISESIPSGLDTVRGIAQR